MDLDKLIVKVFPIREVIFAQKFTLQQGVLSIHKEFIQSILKESKFQSIIKSISITLLAPKQTDIFVNSIMDIIPISTKALGKIGYGITHTLSGVKVLLTGVDEIGNQIGEFGNSSGILSEVVKFNKAGTPKDTDYLIVCDIVVYKNAHLNRNTIDLCHEVCDTFIQSIRTELKKLTDSSYAEKHEFSNHKSPSPHRKKVVILKQVAGQGAMYDTRIFPQEPSGYKGGYSIIDCMNMPVFLSANEYRDGAVRAMH